MSTPAKRLNPTDLKAIFGLEPANAIAYLKHKGYAITWHWQDMLDQAHDQAFTVAKAMRLDLLSDIRAALEAALQQGQTLKQFTAHLQPILQAAFFKVVVASTVQLCRSFLVLLLPIRIQHHRSYRLPVPRLA
ncbi:phage head morphogenesis protein [Pseudomonas sp. RT4P38]